MDSKEGGFGGGNDEFTGFVEDFEQDQEYEQDDTDYSQEGTKNFQECLESFTQKTMQLLEDSSNQVMSFQKKWDRIKNSLEDEHTKQKKYNGKLHANFQFMQDSMSNFATMFNNESELENQNFE